MEIGEGSEVVCCILFFFFWLLNFQDVIVIFSR
jgi:hypothetical protein